MSASSVSLFTRLRGVGLALSAAVLLCSSACKKDDDKASEPPAAGGAPVVKLTSPGAEPRQELRYLLEANHKEKIAMTMTMGMEMGAAGQGMKMNLPPIRMEMELSVTEKLSDSEARCKFSITGVDVLEGGDAQFGSMRDTLKKELQKTIGTSGTLVVDHRGVNRETSLELPADMDPQMKQMMEGSRQAMEQMSSPLPQEAVGVGATWEVDQLVAQNGLKLKQKMQFTLAKLDGKLGLFKTTIAQSADRQVANLPNVPAGVTAELLSHTGTGTGEVNFDLSKLVPPRSTITIKTDSSIKVSGSGQEQSMQMKGDTKVEIGHI